MTSIVEFPFFISSSRSTDKDQTSLVENMVRLLKFTKPVVYTKSNGLLPFTYYHFLSNPGLEIRHFEKNSRRKNSKLKEKLDNTRVKHKDSTKFQSKKIWIRAKMILMLFLKKNNWIFLRKSKVYWLNSIFCFNYHRISSITKGIYSFGT